MSRQTVKVTGLQEALDSLTVFQRARIPGSTAWALNQFVVQLRKDEQELIASTFNKTNAFTRNAPLFKLATKENPRALFFLRDNAPNGNSPDRYLEPQVSGGTVYVTRFSRALQRAGVIGRGGEPEQGQYVMHWANPRYKPTPSFISALQSALTANVGPLRSGRQYSRNLRSATKYFIRRSDGGKGRPTAIFERKGNNKISYVYGILASAPSVRKKYDWSEQRMTATAEREIPKLLFSKLSEF